MAEKENTHHRRHHHFFHHDDEVEPVAPAEDKVAERHGQLTHHHGLFHLGHAHANGVEDEEKVVKGEHHGLSSLFHHHKNQDVIPVKMEEKGEHHHGFFHLHHHYDEDSKETKPTVLEERKGHHHGPFHLGLHNKAGEEKRHHGRLHLNGLFHHHKEAPPPPPEKEGVIAHFVDEKAEQLLEKEVKRHQRVEHVAEAASISAGALALYEKHEVKKDPDHALQHKLDETVAYVVSEGASGVSLLEDRLAKVAEVGEERADQGGVPLALDLQHPISLKARFARIFCCFLD